MLGFQPVQRVDAGNRREGSISPLRATEIAGTSAQAQVPAIVLGAGPFRMRTLGGDLHPVM